VEEAHEQQIVPTAPRRARIGRMPYIQLIPESAAAAPDASA
jgi:hypothetical protein